MKNKKFFVILSAILVVLLYLIMKIQMNTNSLKKLERNEADLPDSFPRSQYEKIDFADEETFKVIREAYTEIDFYGEFKKGDTRIYDFYKEKFLKLLNCETTFFDKQTQREYYNAEKQQDDVMYMLTFPRFAAESKNIKLSENVIRQGVSIEDREGLVYFRLTKEQWDELTRDFFEAKKLATENIKEVSFTYEELLAY